MEAAVDDAITAIVQKDAWSWSDYQDLLRQFFTMKDAPRKCKATVAQMEAQHPDAKGAAALKIGIARYMLCRFTEALQVLSAATDNKDCHYVQGLCHKQLGWYDKAAEEFRRAAERGWDRLQIDMELIELQALQGRFEEAEKALARLEAKAGGTADYVCLRGLVAELAGRGQQAEEAYLRAREIDPSHSAATFRLAYYYDLHGNEQEAIELYKQCLSHPPVYANALMNLAVLYEDAGRYDLAAASLRRVLATNPNHPRARLFLKDAQAAKTMYYDEEQAKRLAHRSAVLDTPITDFELSVRARNCLRKMNVHTLGDLVRTTEPDLLSYKNFGETSLKEIKDMLTVKGLHLGQALEEEGLLPLPVEPEVAEPEDHGVLATPIEQVQLSVRSRKALEGLGVRTVRDLAGKSEADLLACRNFGQTSLNEVRERLGEYGLQLREAD